MATIKKKMVKLSTIKLNENNPRRISTADMEKLKKSLEGFLKMLPYRPIVYDRDRIIIGGNMRFLALQQLGYKEVPETWLRCADDFTAEERRQFIITDNGQFGAWDFDALANSWGDLPLVDWGVEMPQHWGEASLMAKNFNQGKGEEEEAPDTTDTAPGKYPVTFILDQPEWEQWEAAKARLKIQGDKSAFLKLIGGNHA